MKIKKFLHFILLLNFANCVWTTDPDEFKGTLDLIREKGYPAEHHNVETDDGYILTIHRISGGKFEKNKNSAAKKPVVFLQHGLLDSSATWVINNEKESLGFILADSGFDVWLGNMRGNVYGLKHVKYKTSDNEFWDFSWDEMAAHDLPSMIDFALNCTNQDQLFYIGHSQGSLILFGELSSNKELASKIKLFVTLAPIGTIKNSISPLKYITDFGENFLYFLLGKKDFLPSKGLLKYLTNKICDKDQFNTIACQEIMFIITGPTQNYNLSRLAVYTSHTPAGTSVKNIIHYRQSFLSGKIQMYDYGKDNMAKYNQLTAPLYDISKIDIPVALYSANKDWFSDGKDVQYLRKNLPNIVEDYEIKNWDHLDFVWALNGNEILYQRMIKLIRSFV